MKNLHTSVSILISARNEEKIILRLLDSLDKLIYPRALLQVLIANDGSTDATLEILQNFSVDKSYIQVIDIPQREPHEVLKGKTRALAIMAHQATGDYLFFTDADVQLPPTWVSGMLAEINNEIPGRKKIEKPIGVLVGVTGMKPTSLFAAMQALEWFMVITFNKDMSDMGIATTGMGNNMAVLKEAYFAVGAYEKIGFSIVEDYTLYKKIIAAGYDFRQVFTPEVLAYTVPPDNFLEQRKRWVSGAFEDKSGPLVLGLIQALSLPLYLVLGYFSWKIALGLFVTVMLYYFSVALKFERAMGIKGYIKYIPLFSFYAPLSWFVMFINFFLPGKVVWKGRSY